MLTAKTADGRYGLLRRAALLKAMKKERQASLLVRQ